MKSEYKILGDYIRLVDERNRDLAITNLLGVSISKKFIPCLLYTSSSYLDLVIGDKDGEMPAKYWDFSGGDVVEEESVVKVRGTVEQYNGCLLYTSRCV